MHNHVVLVDGYIQGQKSNHDGEFRCFKHPSVSVCMFQRKCSEFVQSRYGFWGQFETINLSSSREWFDLQK